MPIMFCYTDPFVAEQSVIRLTPDDTYQLYKGSIEDVSTYMAAEYSTGQYDRIVLKGDLSEMVAEFIRSTARTEYALNDVEIEVIE